MVQVVRSTCTNKVIFITEFAILGKILPFYEAREIILCMEEFKKKILEHFSPTFLGQKC